MADINFQRLEFLTKALDVAVGDEAGVEAEEGLVDVVASFPANAQAAEAVQPGDRPLDDPDAVAGQRPPMAATLSSRGSNCVTSLRFPPVSDTASGRPCPSVMTWCLPPRVRSTGLGPLLGPAGPPDVGGDSITARDQSSWFFDRSSLSSNAWSWSDTPASFQAARRRQQVMPDPKPNSWGRYSHWMPVCRTNRIPQNACRSGTRGRPSTSIGPGSGSNGSTNDHSSSDTIHGRD